MRFYSQLLTVIRKTLMGGQIGYEYQVDIEVITPFAYHNCIKKAFRPKPERL